LPHPPPALCRFLHPHTIWPSPLPGPRQNDGTFYEIRTYDVKPSKMKEFVELVNKHIHLRAAHSEMVGFWTVELGGMNKAIHIWKFDNFVHRAEVRKALANDKEWQGKFLSPVLPFLNKQNNEIVYLVPWCEIGKPSKEGGELYLSWRKETGVHLKWLHFSFFEMAPSVQDRSVKRRLLTFVTVVLRDVLLISIPVRCVRATCTFVGETFTLATLGGPAGRPRVGHYGSALYPCDPPLLSSCLPATPTVGRRAGCEWI
uniref:NIPSNAP domain-containing protein n=1 Tax=Chelonoidis abingdonii TaxID=106734 RepID=A0A8C0H2G5_CHEAB